MIKFLSSVLIAVVLVGCVAKMDRAPQPLPVMEQEELQTRMAEALLRTKPRPITRVWFVGGLLFYEYKAPAAMVWGPMGVTLKQDSFALARVANVDRYENNVLQVWDADKILLLSVACASRQDAEFLASAFTALGHPQRVQR